MTFLVLTVIFFISDSWPAISLYFQALQMLVKMVKKKAFEINERMNEMKRNKMKYFVKYRKKI